MLLGPKSMLFWKVLGVFINFPYLIGRHSGGPLDQEWWVIGITGKLQFQIITKLKSSLPINYKSCSLSRPKPSKINLWDGVVADVVVLDPPVVVVVDGGRGWRHGDGQRHVGEVGEGLKHHVVLAGRGVLYSDPGKFSWHEWDRTVRKNWNHKSISWERDPLNHRMLQPNF